MRLGRPRQCKGPINPRPRSFNPILPPCPRPPRRHLPLAPIPSTIPQHLPAERDPIAFISSTNIHIQSFHLFILYLPHSFTILPNPYYQAELHLPLLHLYHSSDSFVLSQFPSPSSTCVILGHLSFYFLSAPTR